MSIMNRDRTPFAAGNGFHKVSVGLADLTESSTAMPVTWGFRGAKENRTPDLFHAIHRLIVRGRS